MADQDSQGLILKQAIAQFIHDNGIGVYKPGNVPYLATERGITTSGPKLPTSYDDCIVLTDRRPIPDGKSNLIFPVDFFSRVKGNINAAGNVAGMLFDVFDHKENVPPGLHISWAWEFSRTTFTEDSNGRASAFQTFYFRGRRRGA